MPVWETLAENLEGKVNVAKIDASLNISKERVLGWETDYVVVETAERFKLKGYPTLIYFQRGMYYEYTGSRDLVSLQNFVSGGFEAVTPVKVPQPPSQLYASFSCVLISFCRLNFSREVFLGEIQILIDRVEKVCREFTDSAVLIYAFGILSGALLSLAVIYFCIPFSKDVESPKVTNIKPVKSD